MQRLLHLNRGLPWGACLRFKYSKTPEIHVEISPRIKCSSLRFKCNSLLHLNRGLPESAVYDLSTARQLPQRLQRAAPSNNLVKQFVDRLLVLGSGLDIRELRHSVW